jgi:hypothetical protein
MPFDIGGFIFNSDRIENDTRAGVITDGLALHLDADNNESYPKGGDTWYDISGNGNNGTVFGSVPYEIDGTSCFNFATATGASASASTLGFTFGSNMVPTSGNFTFSCWIKNPNPSSGQIGFFSNAPGADGYRFGVGLNGIYFLVGPTYTEGNISFLSNLSPSLWYNVVAVYSRTSAQILLYLNSVYQNLASIPASQTTMQNGAPGIVRSSCCGIYTGKLAQFQVYSRALSVTEITQNYNVTKRRFGV